MLEGLGAGGRVFQVREQHARKTQRAGSMNSVSSLGWKGPSACTAPCSYRATPCLWFNALLLTFFDQDVPHFHFAPGPKIL